MRSLLLLLIATSVAAASHAEDPDLARLFSEAGVQGTIIISRLDGGESYVHNAIRAEQRFPAASTFKVFNTLIALDEGVVSGPEEVIRWDGRVHELSDWNRDQTLKSAYAVSCVWCYQALARRIGADRYRTQLRRANYGKLEEPFDEATFWLDGSLTISAAEQVRFLHQVTLRTLPYAASSYDALGEVMLMEQGDGYRLRAKTGWATRCEPQIGWYVGYVEKPDATWIFAMNMDMHGPADLPLRQRLVRGGLKAKGILD